MLASKHYKIRLVLEGAVIIASILLAFAIDAGWDEYRESQEVGELLQSIRDSAVDHTYAEAVNSGRLQLIQDHELRIALAQYEAQIQELNRIYNSIEGQYYGQLEPFMVANTIYSEIAVEWWRESLVVAPFNTDFEALARSHVLWNLLTLRLEQQISVQRSLERLEKATDRVLALLPPKA